MCFHAVDWHQQMASGLAVFDVLGLWEAMDSKRAALDMTEKQMMEDLNAVNNNSVPIALATVKNMVKRQDTSCQHSLHMLRWLDRTPESFLIGSELEEPLPFSAEGRLYWNLRALAAALGEEREDRGATWKELASRLDCSAGQLSGLHKVKYGISVHLAMRITQLLRRHSSEFIVPL